MYRAISYFTDLQDNNRAYNAGDIFPRSGHIVTLERLQELSSSKNRRGRPVIVYEPDETDVVESKAEDTAEPEVEPEVETTPDFSNMTKAQLMAYAEENGIDVSSARTRKAILEILNA